MLVNRLRCDPALKPALVQRLVFAGLRSIAAGLVVLTAGGDYKPTLTQCLLNVGPASLVLVCIHSALVGTLCWGERMHIQHGALLQAAKWKYLLISQVCIYFWKGCDRQKKAQ